MANDPDRSLGASDSPRASSAKSSRRNLRVLVIDDDSVFRKTINYVLGRRGNFDVYTAENGEEGVRMALDHKPDLVICDVMMRVMHGYATVAALRDNEEMRHVPIIMITGQGSPIGERRARAHGADYYLYKPFKLNELLDLIREALSHAREGRETGDWSGDIIM